MVKPKYVQINHGGVSYPDPGSFPPILDRVGQGDFNPTRHEKFEDLRITRTTLQYD